MPPYIAREASKLWRRISMETIVEVPLLVAKWKFILLGLIFQYLHGLAARGVHYLHRPGRTLQDVGFLVLPEFGQDKAYISETVFSIIFFTFILWTFYPFVCHSKKIYTVLIWCRVLVFLVACQFLRVITFMSTQLPGPNYHCREGSKLARLPPPDSILEVLLINFPRGVIYGCGDLIFSSHMIFTLVFVLTYQKYGTKRWMKRIAWLMALILSLLIIASRKHYTVDVVVAWYTVNLVVYFVDRQLPEEGIERSAPGSSLPLLSVNGRDKDNRNKDEHHKLMNGNSGDSPDMYRQRTQVNGKLLEDGSPILSEIMINGS